jgi:hypothetical protein
MPDMFSPDEHGNKSYMDAVKEYAAGDPKVLQLIEDVEHLKPGESWRDIAWPWL